MFDSYQKYLGVDLKLLFSEAGRILSRHLVCGHRPAMDGRSRRKYIDTSTHIILLCMYERLDKDDLIVSVNTKARVLY